MVSDIPARDGKIINLFYSVKRKKIGIDNRRSRRHYSFVWLNMRIGREE